jgi:hypothetical protein
LAAVSLHMEQRSVVVAVLLVVGSAADIDTAAIAEWEEGQSAGRRLSSGKVGERLTQILINRRL